MSWMAKGRRSHLIAWTKGDKTNPIVFVMAKMTQIIDVSSVRGLRHGTDKLSSTGIRDVGTLVVVEGSCPPDV